MVAHRGVAQKRRCTIALVVPHSPIPRRIGGSEGLLFYRKDWGWLCEDMAHESDEVSTLEGFGYKRQCASIDAMVEQFFIRVS